MKWMVILVALGALPVAPLAAVSFQQNGGPDSVTIERLQSVFQAAFVDASIDEDGDLMLREQAGLTFWIQIDSRRHLLNFFTVGPFRADASNDRKLAFVNDLNRNIIGATFYLATDDLMIADSYLSFDAGVSDDRIMTSYRWFRDAVIAAIRRDEDGLLGYRARTLPTEPCTSDALGCARVKT